MANFASLWVISIGVIIADTTKFITYTIPVQVRVHEINASFQKVKRGFGDVKTTGRQIFAKKNFI